MKRLVDTQIKESGGAVLKASIYHTEEDGFSIDYLINNEAVKTEQFSGKSIFYVEDAVENWFSGIKILNS
tara:strand:+ start:142 stop:351 length:210 start_codon:yes stop_codon:yes gene_type:complete